MQSPIDPGDNPLHPTRTDDSDADAFAILAVLAIVYFAVSYYLNA